MIKKEIINGIEYEVWLLSSVNELTPQKLTIFKDRKAYCLLRLIDRNSISSEGISYSYEAYYRNGKLHNEYGPAIIMRSNNIVVTELYYIDGIKTYQKNPEKYNENKIKLKRRKL